MKLWLLLEALKPLDPGAEISIALNESGISTPNRKAVTEFDVEGVTGKVKAQLVCDPHGFQMAPLERVEELEVENQIIKEKANQLLKNLEAPREGFNISERTQLLNQAIEELKEALYEMPKL